MILTCPSCTMRYLVSEGAIGPKGRRVRCAHCGHQWTQDPETGLDAELFGEEPPAFLEQGAIEDTFEIDVPPPAAEEADFQSILRKEIEATPIPQGVHPEPDDPVLNQLMKDKKAKVKAGNGERFAGFVTAACVWALIVAALLVLHPQISRAWPPSNLLYDLVGMTPVMPGEGLALDGLQAELGEGRIHMKGTILNLRSQDVKVPAVMASIVNDQEQVIDRLLIAPPIARIKPEGQVPFDVVYPNAPEGATDVTFAFSFVKAEASAPAAPEETEAETAQEESPAPPEEQAPAHEEKPSGHDAHDAPAAH